MTDQLEAAPTTTERRLPGAYLAASYLAHAVTTIGSIVAVVVFLANPDVWPGRWAVVIFGVIFILRMVDPLYEWGTTRILVSDREFRVTTGLINRRTRSIRWTAVHTVESSAPWAYRLFGLVRVRIAQGGDQSTQVTLAGVTRAFRDEILSHSPVADSGDLGPHTESVTDSRAGTQSRASEPDAAASASAITPPRTTGPGTAREALVYRATVNDLVVASILFGRFAVIGVAIAFALFEQLENFGLLAAMDGFAGDGVLALTVAAAAAIIGIGILSSVVRYSRLQVRSVDHEGIRVSYGLIETQDRIIDPAAITGVVLQRNMLEMLLGRVRLGLLTTDTSQQFGSNLLLPSLPRRTVVRILEAGFRDRVPTETLANHRRSPLIALLAFLATASAAIASGWWLISLGAGLGLALIGALVVWGVIVWVARPLATRLTYDRTGGRAVLRTLFIVEREMYIDPLAIHLITTTALGGRAWHASLHYYAGEPRQRGSVRFAPSDLDDLRARLGEREQRAHRLHAARDEAKTGRWSEDRVDSGDVDETGLGGTHEDLDSIAHVPLGHDASQMRLDRRL